MEGCLKDWSQEKRVTEDEMVGWDHWLDGHEFEYSPGVGKGQGGLVCCSPWVTNSPAQLTDWTIATAAKYALHACLPAKWLQSCLTLCDPMDCSPPGSSVHGILQARILEWVVISFTRGSALPRSWTCISSVLHWQVGSWPLAPLYCCEYVYIWCTYIRREEKGTTEDEMVGWHHQLNGHEFK